MVSEYRGLPLRNHGYVLKYLLFVEVLEAELKLLIFGLHGFAQFLKDLKGFRNSRIEPASATH